MVENGIALEWISDAFSGAPEQFSLFDAGSEVGVPRMYDQFTTNLTRLVPTPGNPGLGDITSTLVFIAAAEHDGIVIQCTDRITLLSVSLAGMLLSLMHAGTENGSCGGSEGLSTTVVVVIASAVSFFVAFAMGMMTGAIV